MKFTSIVALLALTGLWSHLGPFETVSRFLVSASALSVAVVAAWRPDAYTRYLQDQA